MRDEDTQIAIRPDSVVFVAGPADQKSPDLTCICLLIITQPAIPQNRYAGGLIPFARK